jgi:hypothetical protein
MSGFGADKVLGFFLSSPRDRFQRETRVAGMGEAVVRPEEEERMLSSQDQLQATKKRKVIYEQDQRAGTARPVSFNL